MAVDLSQQGLEQQADGVRQPLQIGQPGAAQRREIEDRRWTAGGRDLAFGPKGSARIRSSMGSGTG